jgi:hypothetical protein
MTHSSNALTDILTKTFSSHDFLTMKNSSHAESDVLKVIFFTTTHSTYAKTNFLP